MAHQSDSLRSIFFALGANSAIFVAKLAAALMTGSGAMLAEAIHSLADTGNQILLLVGLKEAKRPPTPEYPLGFGKSIYFWSFIVALIMFSMGGMFSIYEGIHKLQHPEPLDKPWIAVGVLLFSIVAESVSLWGCLREVNKVRGGRSLVRWFRESRQSELLVVFGEDLAALLGLSFALMAVGVTMVTGNPFYDALGSIVIGALLIVIAVLIGVEVKNLLIGQGVEPSLKEEMVASLEQEEKIEQVLNLLTLQLGKDVMVAVKAKMQDCVTADDMVAAINACEARFRQRFPQILWLFFEPDNKK
ncbi:MAG: cation diffusion facilitator family transporter [Proteobacteria bacterium]|nr:cation diffusion facilitator family transporter [Pseudomonadota bacterium]MBU1420453.1 cation diffusion facilitator family transporter [Pseudomonadota bacterium]MBU1455414.1 cation diffusion facilitator family transporter [Pseudomonadota bacterium]